MSTYENTFYQYILEYPTGLEYCLNDFCDNSVADDDIQYFKIDGFQFLRYENVSVTKSSPTFAVLEITASKNNLGMSAVDFAKRSLELNEQYAPEKDYYSEETETIIVETGDEAFTFIATGGFEERGLKHTYIDGEPAVENAPEFFEKAGRGMSLSGPHRVLYFDHDGVMYRLIYPIENDIAVDIIASLAFTD